MAPFHATPLDDVAVKERKDRLLLLLLSSSSFIWRGDDGDGDDREDDDGENEEEELSVVPLTAVVGVVQRGTGRANGGRA